MIEILSPVAHTLVEQVIEGGKHAAPCFEFYPPGADAKPLGPKELYDRLVNEVKQAYDAATGPEHKETREAIGKIVFCLTGLAPSL